jgi:hypothetical protein
MDKRKISLIKPLYKYNSKVNSESAVIPVNSAVSAFQWHKCGTLCARGNTKKDSTTKAHKSSRFYASRDSDDSDVVECEGSTYMDFEPSEEC